MKKTSESITNIVCYTIISTVCIFIIVLHIVRHAALPIPSQRAKVQVGDDEPKTEEKEEEVYKKPETLTANDVMAHLTLESKESFRDFVASIYEDKKNSDQYIIVQQLDQVVFFENGHSYNIGQEDINGLTPLTTMGKDINGNGIPDLVIYQFTGGAHCCERYYVFELGEKFKRVATIDNIEFGHFEKQKNRKDLIFDTYEIIFKYWHTSYAQSALPSVKLRFCDEKYRLADDLMRKPPPSRTKLIKLADSIRKDDWTSKKTFDETVPPILWISMLDLIYSGNAESAYKLFDLAWPPGIKGKEKFLDEFNKNLANSEYWSEIKILNEGKTVCGHND